MKELTEKDAWRTLELSLKRNEKLKEQITDYQYALSKIIEKTTVNEGFIRKWSEKMTNYWLGQEYDYFEEGIKQLLIEAGVSIVVDAGK